MTPFLGLKHPIIQAPMAGSTTPALVAAVSEAGGLGSFGAAYLSPAQIAAAAAEARSRTNRPFAMNLFAGGNEGEQPADPATMLAILARHHAALGLQNPSLPAWPAGHFDAQFEAVLDARPAVFSFTFGSPGAARIARAKEAGIVVIGTATTVAEAMRLADEGVDAVVAQGSEAGGHRGTFEGPFEAALIGTMALVPQIVDAVRIPVIASGGIMDGRGIVAAFALGAAAVQLGTAFLTCEEAATPEAHRAALMAGHEDQTALTRAFSGRPARGLVNAFMRDAEAAALPYPLQNALTRPMRTEAARTGDADRLSLWAGQGVRMARRMAAAALVEKLAEESQAVARGLD